MDQEVLKGKAAHFSHSSYHSNKLEADYITYVQNIVVSYRK